MYIYCINYNNIMVKSFFVFEYQQWYRNGMEKKHTLTVSYANQVSASKLAQIPIRQN